MTDLELEAQYVDLEKSHEITVAGMSIAGSSKQVDDDSDDFTPEGALIPPVDLESLARITQTSPTRGSIIDAIALNTVGLGYTLELAEGHQHDNIDSEKEAVNLRAVLEALAMRDIRLDRPSFTDLLKAVKKDEEEVGNAAIEVSRNKITGKIDGLFHVPGKRVRRLRERDGYIILDRDNFRAAGVDNRDKEIRFYNFGDKAEYDDSGAPKGIRKDRSPGRNELITFRLYNSESRDYGLPRDIGLALEYLGDKLAAEFNVSFFDSGGTPPTVIFVAGEEERDGTRLKLKVPQETVHRIAETVKSDSSHAKRVAIIPVPPGTKTEVAKLGQISDRDMGFNEFRRSITRRQLAAFRLSPIFLAAVDDSGRYSAEVERAITLEQVFDPEQDRYEQRLANTLLKDIGFSHMRIKFTRLAVENNAAKRDSADRLAEAGSIKRKELRGAHGFGPLPEGTEEGMVPEGWNDEIISTGRPAGAENRVVEGTDQRGLKPGLAGRSQRSTDEELEESRNGSA